MSHTADLKTRRENAVATGVGTRGIYAERAQDSELWDVDGKRFIDFAAGIAVNNAGHRHPKLMEAVAKQCEAFTHTCFHVAPYESYIRLAERLGAKKDHDAASIDGNDAVYRHPAPAQLDGTQLAHGIEMEISHYADPMFKPKGWALD